MPGPVLVTGCSTGIGLALATDLAARGVPVFATVRKAADAERLATIDGVEPVICDVTDDAQVAHLGHLTATPLDDLKAVFEVNVFGVHRVTNALVDLVVASRRRIVTMSSVFSTLSSALGGAYAMSKHALEAYTDALAKQLTPHGVHVCAIAPGNFESAIAKNVVTRFAPPADASAGLRVLFEPGADVSRSEYPAREPVVAARHAALYDERPLPRYLVAPVDGEAEATLRQAARELVQLNGSTPLGYARAALLDTVGALHDEFTEANLGAS